MSAFEKLVMTEPDAAITFGKLGTELPSQLPEHLSQRLTAMKRNGF
jgi:hypothetical protein